MNEPPKAGTCGKCLELSEVDAFDGMCLSFA